MKSIAEAYRFFVDVPGLGIVQMYPDNDQLEWEHRKNEDFRFFTLTLRTKLRLKNDTATGRQDFTRLHNILPHGGQCKRVNVRFDKYCECSASWTPSWFTGFLRLSKGRWNRDRCVVEIQVYTYEPADCLQEVWDDVLNLFDYGGAPVTVTPFAGEIQEMCCTRNYTAGPGIPAIDPLTLYAADCLDDPETWAITGHALAITQYAPNGNYGGGIKTCWAREYVVGGSQPPGAGWVQVNGTDWARPVVTEILPALEGVELIEALREFTGFPTGLPGFLNQYTIVGVNEDGSTGFPNGKLFNDVLNDIINAQTCGMEIRSNFFNINPDGTAPANIYYTRAQLDAQNLTLHAISDIAYTDETESATVMNATIKQMLMMPLVAFNCDADIDGNILRIEHASYWAPTVQEDLTQPDKVQWIEGKWEWTYAQENLPQKDNYRWAVETDGEGGDFDGVPIVYDNICVKGDKDAKDRTFVTDIFLTNIADIVGDEDHKKGREIIVVSNFGGLINTAVGPLSGKNRLNGNLSFAYLHARYHDYARPFREGLINNALTTMVAVTRNRQQVPIEFPVDCQAYDLYQPSLLIRTQMGGGQVSTDRYKEPAGLLTVNLLHA